MIVLSVGGSLINPGEPDAKFIRELASVIVTANLKEPLAVVTGGGAPARNCAGAVKKLGGSNFLADTSAVLATRQNALLLISALGKSAAPSVPETFEEAAGLACCGRIVVMGGTIPGITTDADAVLLAEMLGAKRVVNISNVDGIYTADPKKDKSAKKLSALGFEELVALASKGDRRVAGEHFVFDLIACKLVSRSKIEAHFVGSSMQDIENAILGKKHSGSIVRD